MNSSYSFSNATKESSDTESDILNSIYVLLNSFMPITITLLGLVGNFLSFVIYSRACFRETATAFYLRVMAVTDSITLIDWAELYVYTFGIDLRMYNPASCKLVVYFSYSIPAMSAWLLWATSWDRMLSISFNRLTFLAKRKFQILIAVVIFVFNSVTYAPIFAYNDLIYDTDPVSCALTSLVFSNILGWFDMTNSTLVPFAGMLISTAVILRKLFGSQRKIFKDKAFDGSINLEPSATIAPDTSMSNTAKDTIQKRRALKDRQFAVTSISLNVLFFILNIFLTIMNLVIAYNFYMLILFLFNIALILFKANFTCPFLVYVISNKRFRTELRDLLQGILQLTRIDRLNQSKSFSKTNSSKVIQNSKE